MPLPNSDNAERKIAQKLEGLTYSGKVKWSLESQVYKTSYAEFNFEIEDSGQNWLMIKDESGKELQVIMATEEVERLLSIAKASLHYPMGKINLPSERSLDLERILRAIEGA